MVLKQMKVLRKQEKVGPIFIRDLKEVCALCRNSVILKKKNYRSNSISPVTCLLLKVLQIIIHRDGKLKERIKFVI